MGTQENSANEHQMALSDQLRKLRDSKGLSLDEVAKKAGISKTYMWELERDTGKAKKPSADVLLRIANALSTTLAELLSLPTVQSPTGPVQIPPALNELRDQMQAMGKPLTDEELHDLAAMKFRGGQPDTVSEWHQLYLLLDSSVRRRES
jgi:transcriptional regulator with XRE-family HTH domain